MVPVRARGDPVHQRERARWPTPGPPVNRRGPTLEGMALSLDNAALAMACDLARPDRDDDAGPANGGRIVALSPLAGKPAPKSLLTDPARLVREFYTRRPDPANLQETVSFGT